MNKAHKAIHAKVVAKAILESPTLQEAYMKTHPRASKDTARKNARNLVTDEVQNELDKAMAGLAVWDVTKEKICQFLQFVILRYMQGKETGANALRAVELASKLVPDFKDRKEVSEIDKLKPEQVDAEIRRSMRALGLDMPTLDGSGNGPI